MLYTVHGQALVDVSAVVDAGSPAEAAEKARMGLFVKNFMGLPTDWEEGDWVDGPNITSVEDGDGKITPIGPSM